MKKVIITLLLMALLLPAAICEAAYTQISQEDAAKIMAEETGFIIVDVRTQEEYDEAHIPSAINIVNETIGTDEIPELPDKDQVLLVYCRSTSTSPLWSIQSIPFVGSSGGSVPGFSCVIS